MIGFVGRCRNESFELGFALTSLAAESIKYVSNDLIHEAVLLLVIVAY